MCKLLQINGGKVMGKRVITVFLAIGLIFTGAALALAEEDSSEI